MAGAPESPQILGEMPPVVPARPSPITAGERLVTVDILRGFALFGVLLVNMELFSTPIHAVWLGDEWWTHSLDRWVARAVRVLAEGKFYLLFSFLFGLGMAMQMERVEARGGRFVRFYARRLLALFIFGLLHMTFLWWGDILATYGLLGFVLLVFRKCRVSGLLAWAGVIYGVLVASMACIAVHSWITAGDPFISDWTPEEQLEYARELRAIASHMITIYSGGSFADLISARFADNGKTLSYLLLMTFPAILAAFLVGLAAARRGILADPSAHRRFLWTLVLTSLSLGLAANVATVTYEGDLGTPRWQYYAVTVFYLVGAPLLSAGYASVVVLLAQQPSWTAALRPLASVGRMALTNYLLQSVICTTIFYSYGLGLYGRYGPTVHLLLVIAIYAAQVVLSQWWLERFRYGPMEWAWRSLTYGCLQPLRLKRAGLPPPTQGLVT